MAIHFRYSAPYAMDALTRALEDTPPLSPTPEKFKMSSSKFEALYTPIRLTEERRVELVQEGPSSPKGSTIIITPAPEKTTPKVSSLSHKILILIGGNAGFSRILRNDWLDRHSDGIVISLVRKPNNYPDPSRCISIAMGDYGYHNPAKIQALVEEKLLELNPESISIVSCAGTADPKCGETLYTSNILPTINSAKGIIKIAHDLKVKNIAFIYLSSIACSYVDPKQSPYVLSKLVAEEKAEALMIKARESGEFSSVTYAGLRAGAIKSREDCADKSHHPHDCEGLATMLPYFPTPGKRGQIDPAFPYLAARDLADIILNIIDAKTNFSGNFDAVSSELVTYSEMAKTYTSFYGIDHFPIYLPTELLKELAEIIPHGKFSAYAFYLLEELCKENSRPFDTTQAKFWLNRDFIKLKEIGVPTDEESGKPIYPESAVSAHLKEATIQFLKDPRKLAKAILALAKHSPELLEEIHHIVTKGARS